MINTKYKNKKFENFGQFDYVVYSHSFTDAQLIWGYDGFVNAYEWLDFTIKNLVNRNKNVLVKAHPNFYEKSYGILSYWDKKIFKKIIDKYRTNKKFWFMNKPIFNYDLLKKLDKNCILITHHGTALLEGSYLGFKTISSISTFYGNKYKHSIMWKNKREYSKVLSLNIAKLPKTNIKDLYCLIRNLYFDKYSYYSNNFWEKIISKTIKISPEKFTSSVTIFNLMNENERKKRINYFNIKIKGKEQSIINNMSKNITEIDFKKGKYKYSI